MKQRRDPITSTGLRVAQTEKLSPAMIRGLRYIYASEERGDRPRLPTRTALALQRRSLVDAHFNRRQGYDCYLTPRGREVARKL